uniref:Uncharacterized protein n=1 Tax=Rhodosorus marinus TaxID=101924 RepID=A0A7S0BE79_9RHOD|mmetsp:Transcript_12192/g.17680  ORF Transcript_12192/g.17680 Transcript_12192/m.17680 type:complete len:139 (+) Transcript_12192:943-1359(+)
MRECKCHPNPVGLYYSAYIYFSRACALADGDTLKLEASTIRDASKSAPVAEMQNFVESSSTTSIPSLASPKAKGYQIALKQDLTLGNTHAHAPSLLNSDLFRSACIERCKPRLQDFYLQPEKVASSRGAVHVGMARIR